MISHINIGKKILAIGLASLTVIAAGCGTSTVSDSQQISSSQNSATTTTDEEGPTIGSEANSGKKIEIVNKTNSELISLFLWPVGAELAEESLMGNGMVIKPDQSSEWYLPEWDVQNPDYYIQGMLRDGRFFVLHNVNLEELPTDSLIEICYTDPVGFLTYTDKNGKEINTYEWELSQKDKDLDFSTDDSGILGVPVYD